MTSPGGRFTGRAWEAGAILAVAVMAAWWCWPWAGTDHVFVQHDTWYVLLALEHFQGVLLSGQPWNGSPLGWPLADAVALADWVPGQALLTLPMRLAGATPEREHVVAVVAGLCLTGWACHQAARALLGPGPHTWVAAAVGGFHPLHLSHAEHLNLVHHEAMVGGALLLGAGLARRRPLLAATGAALAILGVHFGIYMGLHALFAAGVVCAAAGLARVGNRRTWAAAALGGALASLTALPVVVVFARFERNHRLATPFRELIEYSWDLATTLQPMVRVPAHRWLLGAPRLGDVPAVVANDPANPGYIAALLALLGLGVIWRSPGRRWAWAAVVATIAGAMVLAVGPDIVYDGQATGIPGPYRALLHLPGWRGLRDPARWLSVAFVASSLLAAAAVQAMGRRSRPAAVAVAVTAIILLGAERAIPDIARQGSMDIHPDYALLDTVEPGALFDTGLAGLHRPTCRCTPSKVLRAAAFHGRPLAGGRYARFVDALGDFDAIARQWPSTQAADLLQAAGVRVVFEHQPSVPVPAELATCTVTEKHRICVLPAPDRQASFPAGAMTMDADKTWPSAWPRSARRVQDALTTSTAPTQRPDRAGRR